jgi:hypothetical protein
MELQIFRKSAREGIRQRNFLECRSSTRQVLNRQTIINLKNNKMKTFLKLIFIFSVLVGSFSCEDVAVDADMDTTDFFRYVNDEKHYFETSSNKVIVKVGEKVTESDIENFFQKNTPLKVCDISDCNEFKLVRFCNSSRNAIIQLVNQLKTNETILFVGHVVIDETGRETAALTNQINLRLKEGEDFPILQKAVAAYDIGKVEQDEFDSRTYLLIVNYFSEKSALQIANELHETELFEYADPNLILFIRYAITNDTHFSHQWDLRNTGQNGGTSGRAGDRKTNLLCIKIF